MRIVDADLLIKYVKDNFIGEGCNGNHQKEFIDAINELAGGDYVHNVTPCEDSISRSWLLDVVENAIQWDTERDRNLAIHHVRELTPSAQSEPAQWVQMLINPNLYKCSNCQVAWNKRFVFDNEGYSKNIFMKYCPCCGKKMKTEVGYE